MSEDWAGENLYGLLGVAPDADVATITRRYRQLMRTAHPDTPTGSQEQAAALNHARDVLTDPATREEYDFLRHLLNPPQQDPDVSQQNYDLPRVSLRQRCRAWITDHTEDIPGHALSPLAVACGLDFGVAAVTALHGQFFGALVIVCMSVVCSLARPINTLVHWLCLFLCVINVFVRDYQSTVMWVLLSVAVTFMAGFHAHMRSELQGRQWCSRVDDYMFRQGPAPIFVVGVSRHDRTHDIVLGTLWGTRRTVHVLVDSRQSRRLHLPTWAFVHEGRIRAVMDPRSRIYGEYLEADRTPPPDGGRWRLLIG